MRDQEEELEPNYEFPWVRSETGDRDLVIWAKQRMQMVRVPHFDKARKTGWGWGRYDAKEVPTGDLDIIEVHKRLGVIRLAFLARDEDTPKVIATLELRDLREILTTEDLLVGRGEEEGEVDI